MSFISLAFLIFLPTVVLVYWMLPFSFRKYWLLAASYFFYMYWNPALVVLLLLSTAVDYCCGIGIEQFSKHIPMRRLFLFISIFVNLGLLFTFKYAGFFAESVNQLCIWMGSKYRIPALDLLLPVGISFYTFQTLSYTFDVYLGRISAERDPVTFALYVTYFPQLVAGPIENARNLLPQLHQPQVIRKEDVVIGIQLLLSGFFRKVVIADFAAQFVDRIYSMDHGVDGAAAVIATVLFAVQIYCDFSGYSEIAAGSARLMGIKLMRNFDRPYLSSSIRDFWRRWHISLGAWFTDYVYIPLGGSRNGLLRQVAATMVVFLLSGLWHGANWTFVVWGAFHGILMAAEILLRQYQRGFHMPKALSVCATFFLVCFSWIFFRSGSLEQAWSILGAVFSPWNLTSALEQLQINLLDALYLFLMLFHLPWIHDLSAGMDGKHKTFRDITYVHYFIIIVAAWLMRLASGMPSSFIYFQF